MPTNARLTLFRLPSNIEANIRVRMLELKRSGVGKSIERLLAPIDSKATVSDVLLKANLVGKADLDAAKIESESGLTISLGRVNECDLENTGVVEQLVRMMSAGYSASSKGHLVVPVIDQETRTS